MVGIIVYYVGCIRLQPIVDWYHNVNTQYRGVLSYEAYTEFGMWDSFNFHMDSLNFNTILHPRTFAAIDMYIPCRHISFVSRRCIWNRYVHAILARDDICGFNHAEHKYTFILLEKITRVRYRTGLYKSKKIFVSSVNHLHTFDSCSLHPSIVCIFLFISEQSPFSWSSRNTFEISKCRSHCTRKRKDATCPGLSFWNYFRSGSCARRNQP